MAHGSRGWEVQGEHAGLWWQWHFCVASSHDRNVEQTGEWVRNRGVSDLSWDPAPVMRDLSALRWQESSCSTSVCLSVLNTSKDAATWHHHSWFNHRVDIKSPTGIWYLRGVRWIWGKSGDVIILCMKPLPVTGLKVHYGVTCARNLGTVWSWGLSELQPSTPHCQKMNRKS